MTRITRQGTRQEPGGAARLRAVLCVTGLTMALVSQAPGLEVHAAFPGANGLIAFHSTRDGNTEIYVMNPDGSGAINLSDHPAADFAPSWSPDGSRIAFVSRRDGNHEIYVMDHDGATQHNVTRSLADEASPSWSPDGTQIAFVRTCGTVCNEVWKMNADGSDQVLVVADTAPGFPHYFTTAWSPDGAVIAVSRSVSNTSIEIDVVNPDGSGLTPLTSNGVNTRFPNWSPDGSRIVFDRGPAGQADVWVMNRDGSGQVNLTNNGGQINEMAAFSPDGARIVFETFRHGHAEIYVMNADGSGQTRLTVGADANSDPDWQPVVAPSDTTAPVITMPAKLRVPTADPEGGALIYSATALDDVDGGVPVTCTPESGTVLPVGESTLTCEASDAAGNLATSTVPVSIVPRIAPIVTVPGDLLFEATMKEGAIVQVNATARDFHDGAVPVACGLLNEVGGPVNANDSGDPIPVNLPFLLQEGKRHVICKAVDSDGNEAVASFKLTVRDTTPPVLTLPEVITILAPDSNGAQLPDFATLAVDLVAGRVPVVCSPPAGARLPIGSTTVACKAIDWFGNKGHGLVTVVVLPPIN